jgi:hypothetical protein
MAAIACSGIACLGMLLAGPVVAADDFTPETADYSTWRPMDLATFQGEVNGTMYYPGTARVGEDLRADRNVYVGENLYMNGSGSVSGGMSVGSSLNVSGGVNVGGSMTVASVIYRWSDERLKDDPVPLAGLDLVRELSGYSFTWNEASAQPGKVGYGVLAQEVEAVLPAAVQHNGDWKSVDYAALVPVLIEAVKALDAIVTRQQAEIEHLMAQ